MVTFEQARQIVADAERPRWTGDYVVADYGYEDADAFRILSGDPRDLDPATPTEQLTLDVMLRLVDKATGLLTYLAPMEHFERLASMTPIGDVPPD